MGILHNFEKYTDKDCNVRGSAGRDGIGFKLTADGNFDIDGKRLTNLAESVDDNDAVSLKVLKEHTQVSQNNYHLQPSFKIYKEFGDNSQLTVGSPPNTPSNHFFNNHRAHYDPYIVDKEDDDTGFSGEAWSSMKLKGNQLESGSYTVIFEIFVIGPSGGFRVDDTIIYHVYGDSHYSITTFNSNKINGQYTRSMIQFTTDGRAGADDGIKFQIKYFGSQYNKNIKFLFYSRVIKGSQSTSFDHAIFNVSDVQDNHTILYFENLNLNGNLIDGLGDPVKLSNAANKKCVDGEIAKIPQQQNALLLDGSKAMTGDLNMGNKNITNTNKITTKYLDLNGRIDLFNNRIIGLANGINDKHAVNKQQLDAVDNKINDLLKLDGSKAMTGNLDMGNNKITNLGDPLNDQDAATKKFVELTGSNYLKKNGTDVFQGNLKIGNHKIINLANPINNQDVTNKLYADGEIAKIPHAATDVLKLDGSKAMTGNLNMGDNVITGLKSTSNLTGAVNYKQLTDKIAIFDSNIKLLINNKIAESEVFAIESIDQENVFKRVMDLDEFKEEDNDIHKIGVQNKDFHLVNKRTYEFKIDYDSNIQYYSTRLGIDLQYLPTGSYTMVYEMYIDNGITVNEIDAVGDNVSVGKINSRIDGTETRTIIHFTKNTIQSSGDDDLNIDIKLKGKTDPQTTIYVVVYGVKGSVNNVSVRVWDRFYYFDNDDNSIKYEVPINMNNKDITNVKKIVTNDLDVKNQIDMKNKDITNVKNINTFSINVYNELDMKNKKIINLDDGAFNSDAVNFKQLQAIEGMVSNLNNYVNTINRRYYFTDQLKHDNTKIVKFPSKIDSYPFKSGADDFKFRILLDGHYHIIYTDFYKNNGQFIIHDHTNGNDLFVLNLDNQSNWTPITINSVVPITVDNGFNHADIQLKLKISDKAILDGDGYSTFYIRYLHP